MILVEIKCFKLSFYDLLASGKCSLVRRDYNGIIGVKSTHRGRIVPVEGLIPLFIERTNLLLYFWIYCAFVLGENWLCKAYRQSEEGYY